MAELNARIIAKASATASEEPQAADLEVAELAVNTADGKMFTKHTDGSIVTISGGGGVSSVNGETGTVSLGIVDMDDYGHEYTFLLAGPGDIDPQVSGEWYAGDTGPVVPYFAYLTADPIATWLSSLSIGDPLEFVTQSGDVFSTTLLATPQPNTGTSSYIRVSNSWPAAVISARDADEAITVRDITVEDGQVLTYINANSKWEPRDPLTASETRTLLGIGEYISDAAAGSGGVSTGALFYNLTSADYRIKT